MALEDHISGRFIARKVGLVWLKFYVCLWDCARWMRSFLHLVYMGYFMIISFMVVIQVTD